MLKDRVTAIRETMMYEPRYVRHHVTNLRVDGHVDDAVANFSVIEVLPEALPRILMTGRYRDRLQPKTDGEWRFTVRQHIYGSALVPNSIIFQI